MLKMNRFIYLVVFPNLIVNGTSGIAVAMACSFAPHNLNEVMDAAIHVTQNPNCDIKGNFELHFRT